MFRKWQVIVGRGHGERMWLWSLVNPRRSWTWVIRGCSAPPLPLDVCSAHCFHSRSHFQGRRLQRAMWCRDDLAWIHDWTQRGLSIRFKILVVNAEIYSCWPPKTSPICKFSCLLNLPSAHLDWPASFLAFSCLLYAGASFRFCPRHSRDFDPTVINSNFYHMCDPR